MTTTSDERSIARRISEQALFSRLPEPGARDELARRYLPLARHLARRYEGRGEAGDDLFQVACLALVKALDRFDPERGIRFATYASATIIGEIKRHFRDRGWAVNVPRRLQEHALRVSRARADLSQELGRSPTTAEVADRTDLTEDEVLEAAFTGGAYDPVSLDSTFSFADGEGTSLVDQIGSDDPSFELVERWSLVEGAIGELPEREREILRLRFFEGLTQREIGERLGISQMHVSRLLSRTLETLRDRIHPDQLVDPA